MTNFYHSSYLQAILKISFPKYTILIEKSQDSMCFWNIISLWLVENFKLTLNYPLKSIIILSDCSSESIWQILLFANHPRVIVLSRPSPNINVLNCLKTSIIRIEISLILWIFFLNIAYYQPTLLLKFIC